MLTLLIVIGIIVVVVSLTGVAWRTFHDNEQMDSGGSWGNQMLDDKSEADRSS